MTDVDPGRITLTCEDCGLLGDPVGVGYVVTVDRVELDDAIFGAAMWAMTAEQAAIGAVDVAVITMQPRPARWRVYHRMCGPDPDGENPWVPIRPTMWSLLDMTIHFTIRDQAMLDYTDWTDFCRRIMGPPGSWE